MNVRLSDFFKLYVLSTGRRIFALRRMRDQALRLGATEIVARIVMVLAHDATTRRLDLAWSGARRRRGSGGAVSAMDNRMDRALAGLRDLIRSLASAATASDPIHGQVQELLDAIFPAGVRAITNLPVIDQLAAVETIVELLQGDLAPLVAALNIQPQVQRVIELAGEYRAVIEASESQVTYPEVDSARRTGHELFCSVIALVISTYHRSDLAEHLEARAALLGPVLEQNEAVRVYLRSRRPIVDVDPVTGEPTDPVDDDESPETDDVAGDSDADSVGPDDGDADALIVPPLPSPLNSDADTTVDDLPGAASSS